MSDLGKKPVPGISTKDKKKSRAREIFDLIKNWKLVNKQEKKQ